MNKTIENLSSAIREIAAQEAEKHSDIVIGEIAEKNSDGTYDVFIVPDFVTPVTNIPNSSIYDFNIGEGCYVRKYNNQLQSSAIVDKIGPSEPRFGKGGEGLSSVSGSIDVGKTSELQNDGSDGVHPFIDTSALLQSNPMFYPSTSEDKIFSAKAVSSGFTFLTEQVTEFADMVVRVNQNQDFTDSQKETARTNIGAASQGDIEGINNNIANCVQVNSQTFTEDQKTQARTNIGAASQTSLDNDIANCVQIKAQSLTNDQKTQARTNIGALSSADLSVWSQRTTGEEDLNTLADAGSQKAYISRYGTAATNKPTTYGNIISFRSSAGDLTQLALAVTTDKIFYRQAGMFGQYGTWKEVLLGLLEKGDNFSLSLSNGLILQVITDTSGVSVAAGQVTNKKYQYPITYPTVGQVAGITTNESGITTSINQNNSAGSKEIFFRNNTTSDITIRRVNIFVIGY